MMKLANNKGKCVITITQNKRVALPFIFGKYILPRMKESFGEVKLFHVFHNLHVRHGQLESNRDYGLEALGRVRYFIGNKKFNEAIVVDHQEVNLNHLILPSLIMCADIAIKEKADYHLWLQDDAIVFDKDCHLWQFIMKGKDVGLYRNTFGQQMINLAFFLSNTDFSKKLLPSLKEYVRDNSRDWGPVGSQMEHLFWNTCSNPVLLNKDYATRHHIGGKWTFTAEDLKVKLKEMIPEITEEDLGLVDLDFAHVVS